MGYHRWKIGEISPKIAVLSCREMRFRIAWCPPAHIALVPASLRQGIAENLNLDLKTFRSGLTAIGSLRKVKSELGPTSKEPAFDS